ncbi:MAG: TraI domain-containing protein [Gammaproteobacteria bacterium]|nr:TraI domain-containing protein [Gammaproteobacteria bacterium]
MFYREEKKAKLINPSLFKDKELIENKDTLLKGKKRQALIQRLKEGLAYQATHYQNLAQPLIERVAEYYQFLPETSLYFGYRGGLLDRALHRTEAAVNLMRQLMVRDESDLPSEEQRLWLYAIFSAGLLQNIGKLYTEYQINIYDDFGKLVRPWAPIIEGMQHVGTYYNHTFVQEDSDSQALRHYVTLLLAQRLMPEEGFALLAANPIIFRAWLALLEEDRDGAGSLDAILDRANALADQQYLHDYIEKYGHLLDPNQARGVGSFLDTTPENALEKEQALGAEFLLWIQNALESGKIILNQAPLNVDVTHKNIALPPEIYDIFMQEHLKVKNKYIVQRAVNAWQHHLLTDKNDAQADRQSRANLHLDTSILPETVKIYSNQTQHITTVRAIDLVHDMEAYSRQYERTPVVLPQLNANGKWAVAQEQAPQPSVKPSA